MKNHFLRRSGILLVLAMACACLRCSDPDEIVQLSTVTVLASISTERQQTNDWSTDPDISWDGLVVVFKSDATNLETGVSGIFVRDREYGETWHVSENPFGPPFVSADFPSLSADGRFVTFSGEPPGPVGPTTQIYAVDLWAGGIVRVSENAGGTAGDDDSGRSSLSASGRYAAFESWATNLLLPSPDGNGSQDIFVYDRIADSMVRASVPSGGGEANNDSSDPAISGDGQFVAFTSVATDLVGGDGNGFPDVFVHDLSGTITIRVSVDFAGGDANGPSYNADLSWNGGIVVFESTADDLIAGGTTPGRNHVYVRDIAAGTTTLVSVNTSGAEADSDSRNATISADGRYVAFESDATDIVSNDTNLATDVFVRDLLTGVTRRVSLTFYGNQSGPEGLPSMLPVLSLDGNHVVFASDAINLVPPDVNGNTDIFVRGPLR